MFHIWYTIIIVYLKEKIIAPITDETKKQVTSFLNECIEMVRGMLDEQQEIKKDLAEMKKDMDEMIKDIEYTRQDAQRML